MDRLGRVKRIVPLISAPDHTSQKAINVPKRRGYCSNVYTVVVGIQSLPLQRNLQLLRLLLHPIYPTLSCHTWMNFGRLSLPSHYYCITPAYSTGNAIQTSAVYYNHGPVRSLLDSREKSLNLHPRNHRFMKNFLVVYYYAVTHPPFPSAFIQAFSFSYIMPATAVSSASLQNSLCFWPSLFELMHFFSSPLF